MLSCTHPYSSALRIHPIFLNIVVTGSDVREEYCFLITLLKGIYNEEKYSMRCKKVSIVCYKRTKSTKAITVELFIR